MAGGRTRAAGNQTQEVRMAVEPLLHLLIKKRAETDALSFAA